MTERTLTMIVEGKDDATAIIENTGKSVEELGFKIDAVGQPIVTFNDSIEDLQRAMSGLPNVFETSAAGATRFGAGLSQAGDTSARTAEGFARVATRGRPMGLSLMLLASSTGVFNRRAATMVGRLVTVVAGISTTTEYTMSLASVMTSLELPMSSVNKIAKEQGITMTAAALYHREMHNSLKGTTAATEQSGRALARWGVGAVIAVTAAVVLGRAIVNLGKKAIAWTKLTERSTFTLQEWSQEGREAKKTADDLAWAMDFLAPATSIATGGLKVTGDEAEKLQSRISELMQIWGPFASDLVMVGGELKQVAREEYYVALAAAEAQAILELQTETARDLAEKTRGASTATDRWDQASEQLAETTRTSLQPAYDTFLDSLTELVTNQGPDVVDSLGTIAGALGALAGAIDWVNANWDTFIALVRGSMPVLSLWLTVLERLSKVSTAAPTSVPTPEAPVPMYVPSRQWDFPQRPGGYQEGAGFPEEVLVSGSIDVNITMSGGTALADIGSQIAKGISGELQRVGIG